MTSPNASSLFDGELEQVVIEAKSQSGFACLTRIQNDHNIRFPTR